METSYLIHFLKYIPCNQRLYNNQDGNNPESYVEASGVGDKADCCRAA